MMSLRSDVVHIGTNNNRIYPQICSFNLEVLTATINHSIFAFKPNVCDDGSNRNSGIQQSCGVELSMKKCFHMSRLYVRLMPTGNADVLTLKCSSVLRLCKTWYLRIVGHTKYVWVGLPSKLRYNKSLPAIFDCNSCVRCSLLIRMYESERYAKHWQS